MDFPLLLIIIIALALIFDFINGFHDAANSIATIVSTKVLSPFQAVLWAALWNFVAFFFAAYVIGEFKIGNTIAKTVNENYITLEVIFSGLIAAIAWNLLTWWFGIPSSSSHTLIGGFLGAALMHALVLDYNAVALAHPDFTIIEKLKLAFSELFTQNVVKYEKVIPIFLFIFLAPIIGLLWIWLSERKLEPNTLIKFGLGFIFLGLGYYLLFATKFFANLQGITSLNIFTIALLIITFGELCLSPIGLSIMTKLSTEKLQGVMMGTWFLASAYGQYVAGIIGANMASAKEGATNYEKLITYTEGYKDLGIYALVAGLVLILISPFVKKLMQEVH